MRINVRGLCGCLLFVSLATVNASSAQESDGRPPWADGALFYSQLTPAPVDDDCDLCRRTSENGMLVTQDGKDNIYVLDPGTGECHVYSSDGEEIDSFTPAGWEPLRSTPILTGFATSSSGDEFAAATGNLLTLFTPKKVQVHATVETMISSVAIVGRDVVIGQLPFKFDGSEEGVIEWPFLLSWLDKKDASIVFEALEPDSARGPHPIVVGFTQSIEIASDPSTDLLWALDKHKLYRVRRLSSTGNVKSSWISDRIREPARYQRNSAVISDRERSKEEETEGAESEEVIKSDDDTESGHPIDSPTIRDDETESSYPIDSPTIVWDSVARDGFLWVLLKVDGSVAVDVFDRDCEGPLLRLRIDTGNQLVGNIAVVDDSVWVFPLGISEGGIPTRYFRDEDWLIRQTVYGGSIGEP